jgi:cytochrome b561
MAIGIVAMAVLGITMTHANLTPAQYFPLYQLHKSVGITILLATILRIVWRLTHRPPELPGDMPSGERLAARIGHLGLYTMLIALPLTGWALVSAAVLHIPTFLYGAIPWPDLPILSELQDKAPAETALTAIHALGAYGLFALVCLHAAAALRHHFVIKDDVLTRMLPWLGQRQ